MAMILILLMLAGGPAVDCIDPADEALILFFPDRPVCAAEVKP